jgi:hypothetical protein
VHEKQRNESGVATKSSHTRVAQFALKIKSQNTTHPDLLGLRPEGPSVFQIEGHTRLAQRSILPFDIEVELPEKSGKHRGNGLSLIGVVTTSFEENKTAQIIHLQEQTMGMQKSK